MDFHLQIGANKTMLVIITSQRIVYEKLRC